LKRKLGSGGGVVPEGEVVCGKKGRFNVENWKSFREACRVESATRRSVNAKRAEKSKTPKKVAGAEARPNHLSQIARLQERSEC
jgi:hypothetical protein